MSIDLPFKTTFAAQIRAIEPSEQELNEATASLTNLKSLLPEGIDPEKKPQLLYIAANLYVAGMVNLNDDGVDLETSLANYKGFEDQFIDIEHDRNRLAGFIVRAGLSEFGTDRLISEDEARASGKPFNVAIVAALWKIPNKQLCAYLEEASNPMHPDFKSLSLSFEVGFSSYNIGVMDNRTISEAKRIITPADADYEEMSKRLRSYGGSGVVSAGSNDHLYQILSGTFLPLGGGIVTMPAAAVKGIAAITQIPEAPEGQQDVVADDEEVDAENPVAPPAERQWVLADDLRDKLLNILNVLDKKSNTCINSTKSSVSDNTLKTNSNMKTLQEMKEKIASLEKPEDFKQVVADVMDIANAITQESEKRYAELEEEKNRGKEIEKARAEAAAANDELKKNFEALQKELDAVKATQAAAKAQVKFDQHMAEIAETFDLDDDERAEIVPDVKDLDETAFAAWMTKAKKLMKEKTKAFKKQQKDKNDQDADDKKKMVAALKEKGVEIKFDENHLFQEVLASAKANVTSSAIDNTIEVNAKTLVERLREEFEENASIGGVKLKDLKKKE